VFLKLRINNEIDELIILNVGEEDKRWIRYRLDLSLNLSNHTNLVTFSAPAEFVTITSI